MSRSQRLVAIQPGRLAIALVLAVLTAGLLGRSAPASAAASTSPRASPALLLPVPQGFVGVDVDGPMFAPNTTLDYPKQLAAMVANGVQSIRVAFNWADAQPYAGWNAVPPDKRDQFTVAEPRPTDFSLTDEIVGDAALRHITVLPTILYTPRWDALNNPNGIDTPRRSAPYAAYAAELVGRYGPKGSFWSEHPGFPKLPIRQWQIWNEPNLSYYWHQPFARSYVSLLAMAHHAIKKADPGAQVVLGALTNFAWHSIGQIYRLGARNLFDVVSVNGFTKTPAEVILYLTLMRRALDRYGDGKKPMLATEVSWPAALGQTPQHFDFNTTARGQARNIAAVLPMIGAARLRLGLIGFYYYTWIGDEEPGALAFSFSGLLRLHDGTVTIKPALGAFRRGVLALEHCRRKGVLATICIKRR